MIVPAHWSEATVAGTCEGRTVKVKRFGWSDSDEAAAHHMAQQRAAEALARLQRGEDTSRREPKVPYNGAEGVPIREEVVQRSGDTVITRNSYGALCLNTPDVLFADIDFATRPLRAVSCLVALVLALLVGAQSYALLGPVGWLGGLLAGAVIGPFVAGWLDSRWVELRGGRERDALRRVERLAASSVQARVDVYRTPAGLRVLLAHTTFDPAGAEAAAVFRALRADPDYVRMCVRQRCFRARLTAKPWRIGIEDHLRPRPGVWPVQPAHRARRASWLADYDRKAASYAACRFERTFGLGPEHPRVAPVRALHDQLARARTGAPIA